MRGSLAHGVPYAVRLAMMPTEFDRGRHAHHLEPVYALLRPLRLARSYGWRTRGALAWRRIPIPGFAQAVFEIDLRFVSKRLRGAGNVGL